jgi:hypothetical protein
MTSFVGARRSDGADSKALCAADFVCWVSMDLSHDAARLRRMDVIAAVCESPVNRRRKNSARR